MSVFVDPSSNLHPYECDGPGHCIHCDGTETATHNPHDCALCSEGESVTVIPQAQGADIPEPQMPDPESAEVYTETFEAMEPYNPPAKTFAQTTRTDIAHKVHADAVQRIMDLDVQLRIAFENLIKAQNLLHEVGIEAVTRFSRPMDSAWAAWKNEKR